MRTDRALVNMEEIYGHVISCVLLVTALCVNFYLRAPLIFSSNDAATTIVAAAIDAASEPR